MLRILTLHNEMKAESQTAPSAKWWWLSVADWRYKDQWICIKTQAQVDSFDVPYPANPANLSAEAWNELAGTLS
jgi:hypothetical protein